MKRSIWQIKHGFFVGFLANLIGFVLITHYFDRRGRGICFDCSERFGFPFAYLETGGQAFDDRFIWPGLIGNVLLAIALSTIVGWLVSMLVLKRRKSASIEKEDGV